MIRLGLLTFIIFFISVEADDLKIITQSGETEGYIKNNVINWNDIPYAKPPIGDLRWKAPRKIEQNSNKILSKDNNFCLQRTSSLGGSLTQYFWYFTESLLVIVYEKNKTANMRGIRASKLMFTISQS